MRDLMVFFGILVLFPLSFTNSFVAYLVWGWTSLIAIDNYVYGFMESVRLNMMFGVVTAVVLLIRRDVVRNNKIMNPTVVLLFLFLIQGSLSAAFAYDYNSLNSQLYEKFLKELIFAFMMPLFVSGRYRLHAMVAMLCLGLGFHGLIDGAKFVSSGGTHLVQGFKKFGDNNIYAVYLVMVVPLLLYMARYMDNKWLRFGALVTAVLTIFAVIGTHSRGGFISIVALGLWMSLTSKNKKSSLALFAVGIAIAVVLAPSSWTDRMETIDEANKDSSFMARVEAWQISSAIAMKNPMLGGGFHAIQAQYVWSQFRGEKGLLSFIDTGMNSQIFRAAHSIYFEVMGDMGFSGFFLFMALLLVAINNGRLIKRKAREANGKLDWADDMARAFNGFLVAFMVGGAAVAMAYTEVLYMVIILMELLRQEVYRIVDQPLPAPKTGGRSSLKTA